MRALGDLDDLGLDHFAAAVIGPDGPLEQVGVSEHEFSLASISKLLSAYGVLVALEEGTVSLDDAAGPQGSTLRHLLSHASGLSMDSRAVVLSRPGERRIYSNAGIESAAAHLEARSGITFENYLIEAVLAPLSMSETRLLGSPAHGVTSNLVDLGTFVAEWFCPSLVSPKTMALAVSVQFQGLSGVLPGFGRQDPCDFGLGFEIRGHKDPHWTAKENSPSTFGHFGQSGGFVWLDPEHELAFVFLSDRSFGGWARQAWPKLSARVLSCYSPFR